MGAIYILWLRGTEAVCALASAAGGVAGSARTLFGGIGFWFWARVSKGGERKLSPVHGSRCDWHDGAVQLGVFSGIAMLWDRQSSVF